MADYNSIHTGAEVDAAITAVGDKATGPASSTDGNIARYSGTTGKLLKDGPALGSGIGDVPLLEDVGGVPALPAVDGSQLTNLPQQTDGVTYLSEYLTDFDGGVDATSNVQSWIDSGSNILVVDQQFTKVDCTNEITLSQAHNGLTIVSHKNCVFDFTGMANATALNQKIAFNLEGSIGSTAYDVNADAAIGDTSITLDAGQGVNFSAGDLILIESPNEVHAVGAIASSDAHRGETVIIESVSTDTLNLRDALLFAYTASQSPTVKIITPIKDVTINNLNLLGNGTGAGHNGIRAKYGQNIKINSPYVRGMEDVGVYFWTVYQGKIADCDISDATSPTPLGNTGYGLAVYEGSRYIDGTGGIINHCRHAISGGAADVPPAAVTFRDITATDSGLNTGALDCHEPCYYWTFENCTVSSGANGRGGSVLRGQYTTIRNSLFINTKGVSILYQLFEGRDTFDGIVIEDNIVRSANPVSDAVLVNNKATWVSQDYSPGNIVYYSTTGLNYICKLATTASQDPTDTTYWTQSDIPAVNPIIKGNIIDGGKFSGILTVDPDGGVYSDNYINNITNGPGLYFFNKGSLSGARPVVVSGGKSSNVSTHGSYLRGALHGIYTAFSAENITQSGIFADSDTLGLSVNGGKISSTGYAIDNDTASFKTIISGLDYSDSLGISISGEFRLANCIDQNSEFILESPQIEATPDDLSTLAADGRIYQYFTATNRTYNLPPAASVIGRSIRMLIYGSGGICTLDPDGAEQINGAATLALGTARSMVLMTSDGTRWFAQQIST